MAKCKYCGGATGAKKEVCSNCMEKLKLIRQIQGTVKDAKDKADREQRIKEDLKRVRENG